MNLTDFSAALQPQIVETLARQLAPLAPGTLKQAMAHLLGRGKLYRPLLVLATAQAVSGREVDALVPLATPFELIHTFTLIHDDLPCMDDAALRRGQRTVHLAFGEAAAVLAGDGLLSRAMQLLALEPCGLSPAKRLQLLGLVAQAVEDVIEGQMLDLEAEGRESTMTQLQLIHRKKTGSLLGICCYAGALLGGADRAVATELQTIGIEVGLAFQIRDDLLSAQSNEAVAGKTLLTDEQKRKSTYVTALGPTAAEKQLAKLQRATAARLRSLPLREPGVLLELCEAAGNRTN